MVRRIEFVAAGCTFVREVIRMTPPNTPKGKPPGVPRDTAAKVATVAALAPAAKAAVDLLGDPKVREQLVMFGSNLTDSVKARGTARAAARAAARAGAGDSTEPAARSHALRQRRLEQRADKLSGNVELLRLAPGDESTEAMTSIAEVIGRIRLALAVANNLPLRRRIAAQRDIAAVLTKLENAVLSATMPDDSEVPTPTEHPDGRAPGDAPT